MFDGLVIDRTSGQPVSKQIARFVKDKIASSDLAPGEKFPTTQEFIKRVGVGPHTVRRAMKHLQEEGIVKCTPRLGTVVCEQAYEIVSEQAGGLHIENVSPPEKICRIGVVGLIQKAGNKTRYCVETAEGITAECERLGATALVLPSKAANMSATEICNELKSLGCDGVIWTHNDMPIDPQTFDYLDEHGIKVIFRRRSQLNDGRPCVEVDYDSAGYRTGQHFYQNGIKELLIFSHFDFNTADTDMGLHGYPTKLKSGIQRAYENNYLEPEIEVNVHFNEDEHTSKCIYSKLRQTPQSTGIIFTNGYQLLDYLRNNGKSGYKLLKQSKVVAISNLTINYQLRPYVEGLDLMVLVDNFKEVGKLLVGNLMGMLEGYLESGTTTLVDVDFMEFSKSFGEEVRNK